MTTINRISESDICKFSGLNELMYAAFKNVVLKPVDTKISFINRPFVVTDSLGIDMFSVENEVSMFLRSNDVSIRFDVITSIKEDCILDMSDKDIKRINGISSTPLISTNKETITNGSFDITVRNKAYLSMINDALGLNETNAIKLNDEKVFDFDGSINSALDGNILAFCGYIVSLLCADLSGNFTPYSFNTLKQIDSINKKGLKDSLRRFGELVNLTSI